MTNSQMFLTGNPGLDEVMRGGFLRGNTVMIEGYTGTGKTVLGESLIHAGITQFGENGVMFTFEQLPEVLYRDALSLGWDFRALERENKLRTVFISPATLIEEITAQISRVSELIAEIKAKRLFIDGINMLDIVERDPFLKRQLIGRVIAAFRREGLNVIFSREKAEAAPLGAAPESYIADTVIQLSNIEQHSRRLRYLEVIKSRGQEVLSGRHTFTIGQGGITIFPRQKMPDVAPKPLAFGEQRMSFGVVELDEMLRGGLFQRSSTLVAGSSGTGKTLLCLQFLIHGARNGEPGLFLSLEEPPEQIAENARHLATDIDDLIKEKRLTIVHLSPLETDVNQQIIRVREAIAESKVRRFVFDSLSDFEQILQEVEYKDYVYALLAFVKSQGVTSLFTTEIRELTDVEKLTPYGTSYLLDNIIMLRFVELANSLRRAIVVLKTRGSDHANDIREYVISAEGIHVVPLDPALRIPILSIQQYSHILTGFPTSQEGDEKSSKKGKRKGKE